MNVIDKLKSLEPTEEPTDSERQAVELARQEREGEDGELHWYRDCLVCGTDFLLPVCPHKDASCPKGHAVVVDTNDCDCFDNRELLEYPCNCKYCLEAAGYVVDVDL